MTISRSYDELFEPAVRLCLHRSAGGFYSVTDQNGRLFTPPSENVAFHVRFMSAMASKGDAVIDAGSVEAFSVRVPTSSGERETGGVPSPDSTRKLRLVL